MSHYETGSSAIRDGGAMTEGRGRGCGDAGSAFI
ncbi:hypothetical protein ACVWXU_005366 [Streptomyces sp. TE33382]